MERLADRYELGDALGQGRSTVYRAVDARLRRSVAIKRVQLLAGQEDAEQVRTRALREAQASARLNNPSAVAVYDVVEEAGAIWLVMELVDGPSLSQVVMDEGPLPHQRAAQIGLQVLTALEAAHLVGVVHRDVKPANVLVPAGDRAKLTDFGVATIRDESRVTATGLIVGSPSYMSPEQATGSEITPATDLWALGAMLYFAVEGQPPFQAGNALATASAVVHGEPREQQRPGPLSPLLARLLTKDPAARPRAGEVRATLSRVARGRRTRSRAAATAVAPTVVAPAAGGVAAGGADERPAADDGPDAVVAVGAVDATAVQPAAAPPADGSAPVAAPAPAPAPDGDEPAAAQERAPASGAKASATAPETVSEPGGDDSAAATAPESVAGADGPDRTPPDDSTAAAAPVPVAGLDEAVPPGAADAGGREREPALVSAGPVAGGEPHAGTGRPAGRSRLPLVAAGVGLVVALAVAVPALRGDGDDPANDGTPQTTEPADSDAGDPDTTDPGSSPDTTAAATTTTEASALPAGWAPYDDPQGAYSIGLPPGWEVRPTDSPTRVDFVDPSSGSFLRVEWRDPAGPDPVGAWRDAAPGFAANNANYEEIGIGPATYRDYDAALWEFRHGSDETLHTGNLGFVANGKGYALMLRTPESRWAASQPLFEQFKQAFQPT